MCLTSERPRHRRRGARIKTKRNLRRKPQFSSPTNFDQSRFLRQWHLHRESLRAISPPVNSRPTRSPNSENSPSPRLMPAPRAKIDELMHQNCRRWRKVFTHTYAIAMLSCTSLFLYSSFAPNRTQPYAQNPLHTFPRNFPVDVGR